MSRCMFTQLRPPIAEGRAGLYVCDRCRKKCRIKGDPQKFGRMCLLAGEEPSLSLVARAENYFRARSEWETAGCPLRSDEDRKTLFQICQGCKHFDPTPLVPIVLAGGQCKACGCGLDPERDLLNATAWGTYKCKKSKWDAAIAAGVMYVSPPISGEKT